MFRTIAIASVAAGLLMSCTGMAAAESRALAPTFTQSDQTIIARNVALKALMAVDPAGVRTLLDALANAKETPQGNRSRYRDVLGDRGNGLPPRDGDPNNPSSPGFDPALNPDLDILFQRSSPEAAYDLFQIIKRAGNRSAVR